MGATAPDNVPNGEWQGKGMVLVVDDDPAVRGVAESMLETLGLNVMVAQDGGEGVEIFRQHAGEIDLVLMDMTMPKLNGVEAFSEMQVIKPGIRVILISGYNEQEVTHDLEGKGLSGFVQKPFLLGSFTDKVREVLSV